MSATEMYSEMYPEMFLTDSQQRRFFSARQQNSKLASIMGSLIFGIIYLCETHCWCWVAIVLFSVVLSMFLCQLTVYLPLAEVNVFLFLNEDS